MNQLNDIYDPIVGRMLNPDNFYSRFIGNATSTQAYNRYSYVVNNPLKYTDPSGWLKYYNIDGDWRETSYTTWYGFDWEGPGRGSGGGWSTHTGWTSTTYTLFSNNSQQAGLNGYIGGETVPGDYLGSVTFLQPYSYNTFTMPDYSGAGNVVTPTGDMAAMGGYTIQTTVHKFRWTPGKTFTATGEDVIFTTLTNVLYNGEGPSTVVISYSGVIKEDGSSTPINKTIYNNITQETLYSTVPINETPSDFQSMYNAAYVYKNNPLTKYASFLQEIAYKNKEYNGKLDLVKRGLDISGTLLSYVPNPVAEVASEILGAFDLINNLTDIGSKSDDPTKITLQIDRLWKF